MEPDESLFQRVRGGEMAAFDALYERYETRLFAYLRAVTRDRRDAEEVLHDAFLATLRSGTATFDDGGFRAFLFRTARNLAFNRTRASRRHLRAVEASASDAGGVAAAAGGGAEPDRQIEAHEVARALAAAVERLPEPLGELYHLRSSGLSYEQIATVFEVPLGTVKSRMHQMVHVLREELKPWIAPE